MKTTRSAIDYTARLIALGILAFLLLLTLVRARAQTPDQSAASPAGVYKLITVDGKSVPCTINHDGTKMDVQSGTFTITTNGQITSVITLSVGDKKNVRVERTATCTAKSGALTMKWQNAGTTQGHVAGHTLTMTNEGLAYVYQK
ncbi:MAG TPA: hypothetical protein VFZ59_23815 [Verrucomicrobiae bacterium]|nr:hypothetical protein [Verrucomicrobiae bacterium]